MLADAHLLLSTYILFLCAGVASACVKLKGNTWQKFAEEQLRPLSGAKTTGQTCRQLPVTRNQHFPFQESVFSVLKKVG